MLLIPKSASCFLIPDSCFVDIGSGAEFCKRAAAEIPAFIRGFSQSLQAAGPIGPALRVREDRRRYVCRSASIGCTRDARRAGTYAAASPTPIIATAATTSGRDASTVRLCTRRDKNRGLATARGAPMTRPPATRPKALVSTIDVM